MDRFKFVSLEANVWREGDAPLAGSKGNAPLAGNDGLPVAPSEPVEPASRWPWVCCAVAVVALFWAQSWPPDGPPFWGNVVLGNGLALLFWTGVLLLKRGKNGQKAK